LTHNQIIALVQHALDPDDSSFFATVNTIKMQSGNFPDVVPYSVKKEIFEKFHHLFLVERDTNMELDTSMGAVEVREHVNFQNDKPPDMRGNDIALQMLAKTPVWVIAHCLDRTMSKNKKYRLHPCTFQELTQAADDTFLIKGILNPKYSAEVNAINTFLVVLK